MGRALLAIACGFGVIVASVIASFVVVIVFARETLGDPEAPVIDMNPFLWVELVGGTVGALLAGAVTARIGRGRAPALFLAGIVLVLGGLEAASLILSPEEVEGKQVIVSPTLALAPPVVGAAAVVIGVCAVGSQRAVE